VECRYKGEPGRLNRSSCRDARPFYKFSEAPQSAHKIEIPLEIPPLPEFSQEPVTLGDHLRRRRLELGLYQKDVAAEIGVTASTIWNWEHGWTVDWRYLPRVIVFLGYNPIPCPEDLLEQLAWYKQIAGLTLEELGTEMGRNPEQLADWLCGRHTPCRRNREEIEQFLEDSRLSAVQM
jgi:transcriptional regulator with XRE-family HTH domain